MKTTEEKLQHFSAITYEAAAKEASEQIDAHKEKLAEMLEEYKASKLRAAETQVQAERAKAHREMNKVCSVEQSVLRKSYTDKQNSYKAQIFAEVKEQLAEFQASEAYTAYLIEKVQEAKDFAEADDFKVYLSPEDENQIEKIEKATGVKAELARESFLGGVRSTIEKKNILIDHSFQNNLAKMQKSFQFNFNGGSNS